MSGKPFDSVCDTPGHFIVPGAATTFRIPASDASLPREPLGLLLGGPEADGLRPGGAGAPAAPAPRGDAAVIIAPAFVAKSFSQGFFRFALPKPGPIDEHEAAAAGGGGVVCF